MPLRTYAAVVTLSLLRASSVCAEPPKQLGKSRYYLVQGTIHYLADGKTPLAQADPATFVPHLGCPQAFRYESPLAADKGAFYLGGQRIPFANAHQAALVACFSHGDCSHLIAHKGQLHRINQNERSILPVARVGPGFAAIPTGDDTIAPRYFKDARRVYYLQLDAGKLHLLKGVSPRRFKAGAASYSFDLHWGKDARQVFVGWQRIRGAQAGSFKYLGWVYGKDSRRVYCLAPDATPAWFAIKGADPRSFHVTKGRGVDACDRRRCYSLGKPAR